MPVEIRELVESYAVAHDVSKAAALLHYVRLGIAAESGSAPATKADLVALGSMLQKAIEAQPVQLAAAQAAELPEPEEKVTWWRRLFG